MFVFSGSDTTRNPRAGEVNGVDYNFVTRDEFLAGVARKEFIEHAEFSGNLYGTTVNAVKSVGDQGKICILDIDMQVNALPTDSTTRTTRRLNPIGTIPMEN